MDVLKQILDPSVVISLLLAIFSPYLGRIGRVIIRWFGSTPAILKKHWKVWRWKKIRKYHIISRNPHEITWNIVRTYFYLTTFIMCMLFYIVFAKLGTFGNIVDFPAKIQHFIFSPVYVFEVLWIKQRGFTRELIELKDKRRNDRIKKQRLKRQDATTFIDPNTPN